MEAVQLWSEGPGSADDPEAAGQEEVPTPHQAGVPHYAAGGGVGRTWCHHGTSQVDQVTMYMHVCASFDHHYVNTNTILIIYIMALKT